MLNKLKTNQPAPQCLRIAKAKSATTLATPSNNGNQKFQISVIKRYCGKEGVLGSEFFLYNEPLISECIHYKCVSHAVFLHSNQIWHVTELIWKATNDTEVALDKNQPLKIIQYAIMHQEKLFSSFPLP